MGVILTSCGLETDTIKEKFLSMLNKDIKNVKALFIPTAAIDADAVFVLPKCMNDLLKCEISKENIVVYDLHVPFTYEKLKQFDVVYICGGNTEYLYQRICEFDFGNTLLQYISENIGVMVGVSAGSLIFSGAYLGMIKQEMCVHCSEADCECKGDFDTMRNERIMLGNMQAMVMEKNKCCII